jgi:hypothetical protein
MAVSRASIGGGRRLGESDRLGPYRAAEDQQPTKNCPPTRNSHQSPSGLSHSADSRRPECRTVWAGGRTNRRGRPRATRPHITVLLVSLPCKPPCDRSWSTRRPAARYERCATKRLTVFHLVAPAAVPGPEIAHTLWRPRQRAPGRSRTRNLMGRNHLLYPVELQGLVGRIPSAFGPSSGCATLLAPWWP